MASLTLKTFLAALLIVWFAFDLVSAEALEKNPKVRAAKVLAAIILAWASWYVCAH